MLCTDIGSIFYSCSKGYISWVTDRLQIVYFYLSKSYLDLYLGARRVYVIISVVTSLYFRIVLSTIFLWIYVPTQAHIFGALVETMEAYMCRYTGVFPSQMLIVRWNHWFSLVFFNYAYGGFTSGSYPIIVQLKGFLRYKIMSSDQWLTWGALGLNQQG